MSDDETDRPDTADGDEVAAGPRWVAPATDYPSHADQQATWSKPVPGPAPADPTPPTVLPPAYRVWVPAAPPMSDGAA